jgi:hypothetical protein
LGLSATGGGGIRYERSGRGEKGEARRGIEEKVRGVEVWVDGGESWKERNWSIVL